MRAVLAIARNDLLAWRRSPLALAAALVPPLAMAVLVAVLAASVTVQPVALVVQDRGPLGTFMARLITSDSEAYSLRTVDASTAAEELRAQQVAAVVLIPPDFDTRVQHDSATVDVVLNNVDVDFSNDIRRAVGRSVAEFQAPDLGLLGELNGASPGLVLPNVFRVAVAEHNLRQTNVDFLTYNVVPVLILFVINIGVLGTGVLVARDFERGTGKLMLLAPRARSTLVAGRLLGGVIATFAVLLPLVVIGVVTRVMQPPLAHWAAIGLLLAAVTVASVGIGVLLAVLLRRTALVTMAAVTAATYLFLLGGGLTTIVFLPGWVVALSRLVPTSYAIDGLRQALFYPDLSGFATDLAAVCVAALIAVVLGGVALRRAWRTAA